MFFSLACPKRSTRSYFRFESRKASSFKIFCWYLKQNGAQSACYAAEWSSDKLEGINQCSKDVTQTRPLSRVTTKTGIAYGNSHKGMQVNTRYTTLPWHASHTSYTNSTRLMYHWQSLCTSYNNKKQKAVGFFSEPTTDSAAYMRAALQVLPEDNFHHRILLFYATDVTSADKDSHLDTNTRRQKHKA